MVNFLEEQPSLDLLSSDRVARAASLAFKLPDAVPTMLQVCTTTIFPQSYQNNVKAKLLNRNLRSIMALSVILVS